MRFTHNKIQYVVTGSSLANQYTTFQERYAAEVAYNKKRVAAKFGNVTLINIHVDTWFDKANGNTYSSGTLTVWVGVEAVAEIASGFKYGQSSSIVYDLTAAFKKSLGLMDSPKLYNLDIKVLTTEKETLYRTIKNDKPKNTII